MSCDGYYSDASVAAAGRQRRRGETCRSFTCISPWFIFWRRSRGSRNRFPGRKWEEKEKFGGNSKLGLQRKIEIVKGGSTNHEASSSSIEDVLAESGKEASFNLGVGFGVIYVVRNELNKMAELRKRIELLLQDFQNQEKNPLSTPSKSRISSSSSFSNTAVVENHCPEKHDFDQHFSSENIAHPETGFGSRRYRREKSSRVDQMEAEFEAELDHLQHQMDAELFSNYSEQQYSDVNVEEERGPEFSDNVCFEEANNVIHELGNDGYYGVSPRELERKLHELLEARQQERIIELESALEYAMQELDEREREICWWRETARLVSRNLPSISGMFGQKKQAFHCTERPAFEVREIGKSFCRELDV
ncbi:hypothetical protein ACP275_01G035400 [Erythranthe tilingii]